MLDLSRLNVAVLLKLHKNACRTKSAFDLMFNRIGVWCGVGISFCFGDEYGYYLPLPCIPAFAPAYAEAESSEGEGEGMADLPQHVPCYPSPSTGLPLPQRDSVPVCAHIKRPVSINNLIDNPATVPSNTATTGQDWDPSILICRFVGFPLILDKCPYLKSKVCVTLINEKQQHISNDGSASGIEVQGPVLEPPRSYKEWAQQVKQKEENISNKGKKSDDNEDKKKGRGKGSGSGSGLLNSKSIPSPAASNPLSCASRHWARACRAAMLLEWRRGACAEWRVVSELMSSERVTKVSYTKE